MLHTGRIWGEMNYARSARPVRFCALQVHLLIEASDETRNDSRRVSRESRHSENIGQGIMIFVHQLRGWKKDGDTRTLPTLERVYHARRFKHVSAKYSCVLREDARRSTDARDRA